MRTDHAALTWLMKTPTPIGQQARWLDVLGEFHFEITHRPGRGHANADALSRLPEIRGETEPAETETLRLCTVQLADAAAVEGREWSIAALKEATTADAVLSRVLSWVEAGERPP